MKRKSKWKKYNISVLIIYAFITWILVSFSTAHTLDLIDSFSISFSSNLFISCVCMLCMPDKNPAESPKHVHIVLYRQQ